MMLVTLEVWARDAEGVCDDVRRDWGIEPVQILTPGASRIRLELYVPSDMEAMLLHRVFAGRADVLGRALRRVAPRDWATSWRRHFRARDIGTSLRVCPEWDADPERERARGTIIVNPGLSFGTGDHFTTRFCLESMEELCQKTTLHSLFDVGTGSGILAIGAVRLGLRRILAVDRDERALESARRNARLNELDDGLIEWRCLDVAHEAPFSMFSMVCANLYADLLIESSGFLAGSTERYLVVSGITEAQGEAVGDVFAALGGRQIACDGDGEWLGMVFDMETAKT